LIYQRLKSQTGFIALQMLPVILIVMGLAFSFAFLGFAAQMKTQFRSTCTTETIDLQKTIINYEKKLFWLNPASSALRKALQIAEAAALVPATAAQALQAIESIKKAQDFLDKTQKTLIKAANLHIQTKNIQLIYKLNKNAYDTNKNVSDLLRSFFIVHPTNSPSLAVKPDKDEIAPNYELVDDYKDRQMVAYKWQLFFFTKADAQNILETRNSFQLECGATADKDENTWSVEIKKDKS